MDNIVIKRVANNEAALLQLISKQTFVETFAATNTEENMRQYLTDNLSLARLEGELNDAHSAFYFAWQDERVVGYLKLNFGESQTELQDASSVEIERIYVLQELHGKKVGQLLYDKAIYLARQAQATYIWLGVWEHNLRAIRFYQKNGFVAFDKHIFKLGDDEQTDIMMKLAL